MKNIYKPIMFVGLIFMSITGCEKTTDINNKNNNNSNMDGYREYDKRYFSALINNQDIFIGDTLLKIAPSRILTNTSAIYNVNDSLVMHYSIQISDSFTLNINFTIKEEVGKLDSSFDTYYYEWEHISELEQIVKTSRWKYHLDTIPSKIGQFTSPVGKTYAEVFLFYSKNGKNYYSEILQENKSADFKIIQAYVKPVIINYHQDGSGEMDVDSVLYVEGKFSCGLLSEDGIDQIEISNAVFKCEIATDVFYDY